MESMALGLFIAAIWVAAAFPQTRREAPSWIARRPLAPAYFAGIGVARIEGDLPAAREQATQNALNDIALQVEARVSSESRLLIDEEEEGMDQEYRSEIRTQVAEDLEGVEIADTYEDAEHCWVFARLSVEEFQRRRQEQAEAARRVAFELFARAEGKGPAERLALYLRALEPLQQAAGNPLSVVHRGESLALATEIPLRVQQLLSAIHLEAAPPRIALKQGARVDLPLEVSARFRDEEGQARPMPGLPVRLGFVRGEGELVSTAVTGEEGTAQSRLRQVRAPDRVQVIEARVDLPAFFSPDSRSTVERVLRGFAVPAVSLSLQVAPQAICVASQESNLGNAVACLGPLVRAHLERRGQGLVESASQADLVVQISARTRAGTQLPGICFAFLDLELKVRDRLSGEEVFAIASNGIKGAGPDCEQAGIKAFEKAGQQLEEQVLPELLDQLHR